MWQGLSTSLWVGVGFPLKTRDVPTVEPPGRWSILGQETRVLKIELTW